jgi:transcriptional regulator with XRE-family HTH domain
MTSNQFRQARQELGLTQVQLGKIMGRGQSFVSELESGKRTPTKVHAAFIRFLQEWKAGNKFPG